MKPFKKNHKGQALAEMLISIPVLFLFAAGIIQFAILFLSYVQFEHACGEAARQYSANLIDKDSLGPQIEENLGPLQRYLDLDSLRVTAQGPRSTTGQVLEKVRSFLSAIPFALKYEGSEWSIDINCRPPFFFAVIFPRGVPFHTVMQVYRYPR